MKPTLLLLFAINFLSLNAQFTSAFYHLDAYKQEASHDSLIRNELDGKLTESYYLITYPILAGATSWVPQFIRIYNNIKNTNNDIVILFYLNGGLRKKDISLFMKDKLKLSDAEINRIKLVYSDDLYSLISNGRHLVRLQYYFRRNLYYDEAGKWHDVAATTLPQEQLNIVQTHKIKLKGIDTLLLFERDQMFWSKKDKLLIMADAKNEILELDVNTGEVKSIITITNLFTSTDIFCKYFSKEDTAACNYAKNLEHKVTSIGRQTLKIDGVDCIGNYLYLSSGIEAFIRNKKEYSFKNEEGQKVTIAANEPTLSYFGIIFKYDLTNKTCEVFSMQELPETKKDFPYIYPDCGFTMKEDTIIAGMNVWHNKGINTFSLINLILKNGTYTPGKTISPSNIKSPLLADNYNKSFFYTINNKGYFSLNFSGNIYLVGNQNIQSTLYGNGSAPYQTEKVPEFVEDTSGLEINFSIHDMKPVLNNKYLLTYCDYKNQPILEVKNQDLETIDIIDAKSIIGLERYLTNPFRIDLLIAEDKIYYKSIEQDEMYLNVFSIIPAEPNQSK